MKIKVAVPNSRNSSTSKAEANSKVSTESESKSKRSGDERSVVVVSSPVIKVDGSTGVEVTLEVTLELEATKVADRINPNGAWIKSEAEAGAMGKEAPVSIKYRTGFGWMIVGTKVGTESEVAVVAEATTVGAGSTVGAVSTVAAMTEVVEVVVGLSPIASRDR